MINIVRRSSKLTKKLKIFAYKYLIDHESTINTRHINGSKLHLNKKDTKILFNNFKEAISNILQWQFLLIYSSDSSYYIVLITGIIVRVIMILMNIVPNL